MKPKEWKVVERFLAVLTVTAVIVGAAFAGTVLAEQHEPAEPATSASGIGAFIASEEKAEEATSGSGPEDALFELPDVDALKALGQLDPEMRDAAVESMREYYRYRESGYKHRRAVFDWQLTSSKLIFWVVIVLVAVSIYFSGVQFHTALRSKPAARSGESEQAEEDSDSASPASGLQTSIEAGGGGIKVSSPVLGVIILVISLLFFYLYLVHIYPISEIW
jgi:uncharacterized membrane protein